MLEVINLSFQNRGPYRFTVENGTCLGLSGPSGSGKTLLLRAIADLDCHNGDITLDSARCSKTPAPGWRRSIGMLPAESYWWHDDVGSHFADAITPSQTALLQQLGFDLDVMHWSIERLSTGERQRLAIFRLLLNRPAALLLDEPTASLDPKNIGRVESVLQNYWQKNHLPAIWISHDNHQLQRLADRQLVMQPGGILIEHTDEKP